MLIAVFMIYMFARSYWVRDALFLPTQSSDGRSSHLIESEWGLLRIRVMNLPKQYEGMVVPDSQWVWRHTAAPRARPQWYGGHGTPMILKWWHSHGFGYLHGDYDPLKSQGPGLMYQVFVVPLWVIATVFCVPCTLYARHLFLVWRKRTRVSRRLCIQCGYDVRGLNGQCPECGAPLDGEEV